jgi:peptide/nickel transport system permease protein
VQRCRRWRAASTICSIGQGKRLFPRYPIDIIDYSQRCRYGHLLRNALLPIITLIGLSLPAVLSGEVITESVFNYPGMGLLFWNAATTHDYPVLMGVTIVVGAAVVLGSLLADILYAVVDPRVRYA